MHTSVPHSWGLGCCLLPCCLDYIAPSTAADIHKLANCPPRQASADCVQCRGLPQLLGDQELELVRFQQVQVLAQGVSLLHSATVGQGQIPQLVYMLEEQPLHLHAAQPPKFSCVNFCLW